MNQSQNQVGSIEVVCGCMFSGKTTELLRKVTRAKLAKQSVIVFKPALDTRYSAKRVTTHDALSIESIPVEDSSALMEIFKLENSKSPIQVVGIDEAQFFDAKLPEVASELAIQGSRVIIAGLDRDFLGKPFGTMPILLALAEHVTKLEAVCTSCGRAATHTYRIGKDQNQVVLGADNLYEARCRGCWQTGLRLGSSVAESSTESSAAAAESSAAAESLPWGGQRQFYLNTKSKVAIVCTEYRGGHKQWAVVIADNSDFWLDAFSSSKQAVEFCESYKLPIVQIVTETFGD